MLGILLHCGLESQGGQRQIATFAQDLNALFERVVHILEYIFILKHVVAQLRVSETGVEGVELIPLSKISHMHVLGNLEISIFFDQFPVRSRLSLDSLPYVFKTTVIPIITVGGGTGGGGD